MKFRIRLTILLAFTALIFLSASSQQPPTPASTETQNDLAQALAQRLQSPGLDSLTLDLFSVELDTAFLTPDGNTALLWLALKDDEGIILATEPGLALAQRTDRDWQVFLPGDARWDQIYALLPTGFLPGEHSPLPDTVVTQTGQQTQALTGYYLPYAAGTSHFLEGSIGHFQSIPWLGYPSCPIETCRYAYDFTDTWRYPLLASRGGVVFSSRDACINGSPYCTNYIVLREPTTNTYQIYLHLANGTVPDKLTPGTTVLRGQYLGNIDDTGYSTSQHVHFMVTDSVWLTNDYYSYYWGRSIDIRFADVSINQGIPRTCYEVTQFPIYDGATECLGSKSDPLNPSNDWFVSGNIGAFPPTGHLTEPVEGQIVVTGTAPIMDVTASLSDDVGVVAVQLLAKLGGSWKEVGPKMSQAISPGVFDWDVDLCKLGPLNGTLEIALKVWDYEGNIASPISPISIQVDHACPPPISQLNQPQTFDSSAIKLSWEASTSGVALSSLELQWKEETGEWQADNLLTFTPTQKSTWFVGQQGKTYGFRLRALDVNGQAEAWPSGGTAEFNVSLPGTCQPDAFEPDNTTAQATQIFTNKPVQANLCGPADADWFRWQIDAVHPWFVSVKSLGSGAAIRLAIFDQNGSTLLASSQSPGLNLDTFLVFTPTQTGTVYIKVLPLVDNLCGTDAKYQVLLSKAHQIFLPFTKK